MGMEAELQLEFVRRGEKTECRLLEQSPPWKVVRGFTRPDGENLVHLGNVSGGIFGGDRLHLRANLNSGAQAMITTSGATRIYRPLEAAPQAVLDSEFTIGSDALLEYLPDLVIPFRGARLLQRTKFALAAGATLLAWDVIAPGRAASGEVFAYERMKLATEISVCGKKILDDRLLFEPGRFPAALGQYRYLVTLIAVRAGSTASEVRQLEASLAEMGASTEGAEGIADEAWATNELPAYGVMVRGALRSPLRIPQRMQSLWSIARQEICGRTVALPRKTY